MKPINVIKQKARAGVTTIAKTIQEGKTSCLRKTGHGKGSLGLTRTPLSN